MSCILLGPIDCSDLRVQKALLELLYRIREVFHQCGPHSQLSHILLKLRGDYSRLSGQVFDRSEDLAYPASLPLA